MNVSDNESQRVHLTTALPQYAHPVARADAAKRLSQPARKAIAVWCDRELGFTKPQWRAQLDVTDFSWRVQCGLCAAHTEFETRLSTAEATARQRGINYAYFEFPDYKGGKRVGKAAGHLGRCLSLASVAEGSANLPLASQLYADFLTQLPKFADPAVAAVPFRASPIQCAELLERVCCYALCVTAQAAAREPAWLPRSLVAALPVDGRWKVNVEQLKPTMRHLRAALNAVRPLGLLAVNQPTHTRTGCSLANVAWGPAAAERAGIALLVLCLLYTSPSPRDS